MVKRRKVLLRKPRESVSKIIILRVGSVATDGTDEMEPDALDDVNKDLEDENCSPTHQF